MTEAPKNIHPAVARSLDTWHHMVASRDLSNLLSIVHPDAVFRSPMANTAYTSAPALMLALSTVIQVFEDFTYHRELVSADGHSVVLEFSAKVGERGVKGIDFIRFNEDGQIVDFEVMMRPLNGVQAMAEEMGKRLGAILPGFKAS